MSIEGGPFVGVVSPDPTFRYVVARAFERAGMPALACSDHESAIALVDRDLLRALVVDTALDDADASIELVETIRYATDRPGLPAVVCSADDRVFAAYRDDLRALSCAMLGRPWAFERLHATLLGMLPSTARGAETGDWLVASSW